MKKLVLIGLVGYVLMLVCWLFIFFWGDIPRIREVLVVMNILMMNYLLFLLIWCIRHNMKAKKTK